MNKRARIDNGIVAEILLPAPGFEFEQCYAADILAACKPCGPDVQPGWTYDGTTFSAPAEPEPPALEETIAAYETLIQQRLDDFARTLTYDGILSACTYATSNVEMYRVEGQYCVDARDRTWAAAYELMSVIVPRVMSGGALPAWEEIEAQLPPLVWPAGSRGCAAEGGQ